MAKTLVQPFVVDNRAGAGGVIGHAAGARAQPNGYTLTATANGSFVVTPKLQPGKRPFESSDVPWDQLRRSPDDPNDQSQDRISASKQYCE
ncbi:hypothetical protein GCM10023165_16130 [Variovorax defluvii]|uniref:Uncharacterized protein n=2 Tax=Variovorax defluvii TaxID=913761 RepID=A0ABP8HDL8_9BURK